MACCSIAAHLMNVIMSEPVFDQLIVIFKIFKTLNDFVVQLILNINAHEN